VSERVVYGKIFADDRGEAIYRDMGALWQAAQGAECLRVPEPLGYDPRRRMLMMAEAPGEHDLKRWVDCLENERPLPPGVDRARLDRSMAVVAQMLAELHRSGIQPRETRTFKSELDEQRNDLELMRHGQPALGRGIERVLERLEADAPVDEPLVPSHGDFRLGQLIGNERRMTLLDWDSPALAHPALNAAMFLRRLRQEPIIHPGKLEELERLADVFRHEFLAREPEVDRCSLARYEALTLSAGALRALRHPKRGAAAIDRFLAEAGRLLNGGSGGVNPP
jgi:aminoglycoside phosphotransferase (APT) family kinase protein